MVYASPKPERVHLVYTSPKRKRVSPWLEDRFQPAEVYPSTRRVCDSFEAVSKFAPLGNNPSLALRDR